MVGRVGLLMVPLVGWALYCCVAPNRELLAADQGVGMPSEERKIVLSEKMVEEGALSPDREATTITGSANQSEPEAGAASTKPNSPVPFTDVPAPITIVAVGDMMLGGSGASFYQRDNYDYAFAQVGELLRSADVFIGNVETALTDSNELLVEKKYRFKNPPHKVAAALARAGMDVANLANNHSLDYGYSGLDDTLAALSQQRIATVGAGSNSEQARRAVLTSVGDTSIGFLAYSNTYPREFWATKNRPGTAFGHASHVRADVAALKTQGVDIVLVSFHWGREGTTKLRSYQPLLARAAIDAGADVVVGHHPHILQAIERYKHGVIFYSLGNFTFGSYSRRARDSAIAIIMIEGRQLSRVKLLPINVFNPVVLFQPHFLQGKESRRVVAHLQELSAARNTQLILSGDHAVIEWPANTTVQTK